MRQKAEKEKKIRTRCSIRAKIMITTIVIVVVIMWVCTAIQNYSMNNLSEDILIDVLQPIAGQSAEVIETNIQLMTERMSEIAGDSRLTTSGSTVHEKMNVLSEARNTYEFYGIGVYDLNGTAEVKDGEIGSSVLEEEWFQHLKETDNIMMADPLVTETYVGIPMGVPIKTDGTTIGYLIGIYEYDMFSEALGSIHLGKSGMALMINKEGKIVGHPSAEIVGQELNIYELDADPTAHAIFDSMVNGEAGATQGVVNGQESYVAYCPVEGTEWSFAVEVPKTDYGKSIRIGMMNTMVGTFGTLIVALIAIWSITTVISVQLKKSIARMNGLAEGDLKTEITIKKSGDEVEVLSRSLQTTIDSLNGYLTEIHRVLESISEGNLNISADGEYRGDFVVVKESLTQIIDSLNKIMKRINKTALRLMDTAQNMGSQSEELHQAVINQTEAMNGLNNEVGNIKNNLEDVTENTRQTREKALEIANQIASGSQKMQELQRAMSAIDRSAEDITKISKLIEDISQQTNILALNASVEAARAGVAGKGFAVVAQEVRSLAAQSAEAAKNTVEMIETAGQLIKQGVKLTEETSYALEEISRGSDAVTAISQKLSETVDIQEASLLEMTGRIEELAGITQQNLQTAENTADASVELEMESKKLKELLTRFQFH